MQRHAIFTVTKKFPLGTKAASCTFNDVSRMTAVLQHHRSHAGTSFTKAMQQCCVAVRPVVIYLWNKHTGPGLKN